MVKVMTGAGIPLHVFRNSNLKNFFDSELKFGPLPCETTLRKCLVNCGDDDFSITKTKCTGKDFCLCIDETIDIKNRKLVNVLIKTLDLDSNFRLVKTQFVDNCNANTIVDCVLDTLEELKINRKNFCAFITDNAPYMYAAASRLKGLSTRVLHSTCWSHILHLVAEEIRAKFKYADKFVAQMKQSLSKCPGRRERFSELLLKKGIKRLPPKPVITRWGTWLTAAKYYFDNYYVTVEWIESEDESESMAIKSLKKLTKKNVFTQLKTISMVSEGICNQILKLESDKGDGSLVWINLKTISQLLSEAGFDRTKLDVYTSGKHPAFKFWKQLANLNPSLVNIEDLSADSFSEISFLAEIPISLEEICAYKKIIETDNVCRSSTFWKKHEDKMPIMSQMAQKALSVPSSSASVERSFSTLSWILNPLRSSLTEDNLGVHLRMAFNSDT